MYDTTSNADIASRASRHATSRNSGGLEPSRLRRYALPDPEQPLLRFLKRQYARALSVPAELALRLMNLPQLDGSTPRRSASLPAARLPRANAAVVEAIERDGFCVTSLAALGIPGSAAMLDAALDLSRVLAGRARRDTGRHTLFANAADLLAQPRILQWGLEDQLLDIVEAYLGTQAAYGGASYSYSVADGREAGTRVWHRDREDHRMLKVGLYISNVTHEDGPLELLRRSWQERLDARRTQWRYQSFRQADLEAALPEADPEDTIHSLAGPRGRSCSSTPPATITAAGRRQAMIARRSITAISPGGRAIPSVASARRSRARRSPASPGICPSGSATPSSGARR